MASAETYLIQDGVRRAKLYLLAGNTSVTVDVIDKDDNVIETIDVPIDDLRAPRLTIDLVTDPNAWYRFKRLENAVFRGMTLPAVRVRRASGGTAIVDVVIER